LPPSRRGPLRRRPKRHRARARRPPVAGSRTPRQDRRGQQPAFAAIPVLSQPLPGRCDEVSAGSDRPGVARRIRIHPEQKIIPIGCVRRSPELPGDAVPPFDERGEPTSKSASSSTPPTAHPLAAESSATASSSFRSAAAVVGSTVTRRTGETHETAPAAGTAGSKSPITSGPATTSENCDRKDNTVLPHAGGPRVYPPGPEASLRWMNLHELRR
jgi:hypothetical protein